CPRPRRPVPRATAPASPLPPFPRQRMELPMVLIWFRHLVHGRGFYLLQSGKGPNRRAGALVLLPYWTQNWVGAAPASADGTGTISVVVCPKLAERMRGGTSMRANSTPSGNAGAGFASTGTPGSHPTTVSV